MEAETSDSDRSTRRMVWIVGASVVVALVVVGGVIYALIGLANKGAQTAVNTKKNEVARVATSGEVQHNISSLNVSIEQLKADKAAAAASLIDQKNQVKVGG